MLPNHLFIFIQLYLLPVTHARGGWFTGPTLHATLREDGVGPEYKSSTSSHSRRAAGDEGNEGGSGDKLESILVAENVTVRFKNPFICETTPGVNSYSGYVDLDERSHTFFWFFEAKSAPEEKPITLWLNGGPGSDSLIGLLTGWFSSLVLFPAQLFVVGLLHRHKKE
jgi:hypothetical protein